MKPFIKLAKGGVVMTFITLEGKTDVLVFGPSGMVHMTKTHDEALGFLEILKSEGFVES